MTIADALNHRMTELQEALPADLRVRVQVSTYVTYDSNSDPIREPMYVHTEDALRGYYDDCCQGKAGARTRRCGRISCRLWNRMP